jgi:pimeloyl-ACP methyl ester carboxylesterase
MQRMILAFLGMILVLSAGATCQEVGVPTDAASPKSEEIRILVDHYLSEVSDEAASQLLADLLKRADLTGEAVYDALTSKPPKPISTTILIPFRNQQLHGNLEVPPEHRLSDSPLPVVLSLGGGELVETLGFKRAIVIRVPGYTPPQFSDESRDGFLKILAFASWFGHGDPDQFWMIGASWGGHASCDTALHRPDHMRGVVAFGGGPRRVHFRLLPNLQDSRVGLICGLLDDPELVWNLKELELRSKAASIDVMAHFDPKAGHTLPLMGQEHVAAWIEGAGPRTVRRSGVLLANGPEVRNRWLEILSVKAGKTEVPARVPVRAGTGPDEQRRATLKAMENKVAAIHWNSLEGKEGTTLDLRFDGVTEGLVHLRVPMVTPGKSVQLTKSGRRLHLGPVTADAETMLKEARRDGLRQRPVLKTFRVR